MERAGGAERLSGGARQDVERGSDLTFITHAEPLIDYHLVRRDRESHRLAEDVVGLPDGIVEAPQHAPARHELGGAGRGCFEPGPSANGEESHFAVVIRGDRIDDGQLPPAGASPLRPEHQIDGSVVCAHVELRAIR